MSFDKIEGIAELVLVDDIDTDQIFHASLLTIHEPEKIKPHIFGNLPGFNDFGQKNHDNHILIVGKNFGKGSTRQQAVTGFLAHGIKAIIGSSFAPIYYNNAINAGLFLIETEQIAALKIDTGDLLEINVTTSEIINKTKQLKINIPPVPKPVLEIISAGGLLALGKQWSR